MQACFPSPVDILNSFAIEVYFEKSIPVINFWCFQNRLDKNSNEDSKWCCLRKVYEELIPTEKR